LSDPEPTSEETYAERNRRSQAALDAEEKRLREIAEAQKAARIAAGMGFWRLVWVVAFGILIAQMIGAGVGLIVSSFRDSDGDEVSDLRDKCPTVSGRTYLNGCPSVLDR
jgi:hypothetical protein